MDIRGLIPATLTPFDHDGRVDHAALAAHVRTVSAATGLFGVAANGHAGEVLALTSDERQAVLATVRAALPKPLRLIAGIESHSPDGLVREGRAAKEAGADLLLVIPPFDIRIFRHWSRHVPTAFSVFQQLEREVGLPMIVFQYPEAAGCAYSLDALSKIADLPSVVGIKASAGSPTKYAELHDRLHDRLALLAAADSPSLLGMLLHDAPGALIGISVVGTQQWSDLVFEATRGSADRAKDLHNRFAVPLMRAIFEYHLHWTPTCPFGATKEALVQLGEFSSSWVRPPGVNVDASKKAEIRRALLQVGLMPASAANQERAMSVG
ncbi:MAG: dihydrodipicolinate synthase family protein [Lautropia sp.]